MRSRFRINAKLYVVTDSLKCNRCCVAIVTVQGAEMFDIISILLGGSAKYYNPV